MNQIILGWLQVNTETGPFINHVKADQPVLTRIHL